MVRPFAQDAPRSAFRRDTKQPQLRNCRAWYRLELTRLDLHMVYPSAEGWRSCCSYSRGHTFRNVEYRRLGLYQCLMTSVSAASASGSEGKTEPAKISYFSRA